MSSNVNNLTRAVGSQRLQCSLSHTLRHKQRVVRLDAEVLLAHRGLCALRVDAVNLDAVAVPLLCHRLHKVYDGSLCRRVDAVERFIINQIIPTALSINYLSSPSCHRSVIYESNSTNCNTKVKVLIEKIPFIIKETDVPSISTTNEELLDTALNYIDEIIE